MSQSIFIGNFPRRGPRILLRAAVAAAYAFSNVFALHAAESNVWAERRAAARRMNGDSAAPSAPGDAFSDKYPLLAQLPPAAEVNPFSTVDLFTAAPAGAAAGNLRPAVPSVPGWVASLILPYGSIRNVHLSKNPNAPLVVHVQDAHEIEEAQRNTAAMIEGFSSRAGVTLVGLEGAEGGFDLDAYRASPDKKAVKSVAGHFLKLGYLGGAEYAAVTMPKPPVLWGVEALDVYLANIKAYQDAVKLKPAVDKWLKGLEAGADSLKAKTYSDDLKSFDRHFRAYKEQREGLGDYVAALFSFASPEAKASRPNLQILLKALSAEKSLDFKRVEKERAEVVEALARALDKAGMDALVRKSLDYREGRLGYGDFHRALKDLCASRGVRLSSYEQFSAYVDYVLLADRIDRNALLAELEEMEESVPASLAATPAQKALVTAGRHLAVLKKLTNHQMTPADWAYYAANKDAVGRVGDKISGHGGEDLSGQLTPFEDFCRLALQRNEAFAANLLDKMKKEDAKTAFLVAGGFHTDGLTRLLDRRDVSYIVVTPKITEVPKENHSLDVFVREPIPLEKLFAGEKIYLKSWLLGAAKLAPAAAGRAEASRNEAKTVFALVDGIEGRAPAVGRFAKNAAGYFTIDVGAHSRMTAAPAADGAAKAAADRALPAGAADALDLETVQGDFDVKAGEVSPSVVSAVLRGIGSRLGFGKKTPAAAPANDNGKRATATKPATYPAGVTAFRGLSTEAIIADKVGNAMLFAQEDLIEAIVAEGYSRELARERVMSLAWHGPRDFYSDPDNNLLRAWINIVYAPDHENNGFVRNALFFSAERMVDAHIIPGVRGDELERRIRTELTLGVEAVRAAVRIGAGEGLSRRKAQWASLAVAVGTAAAGPFLHLGGIGMAVYVLVAINSAFFPLAESIWKFASAAQVRSHKTHNVGVWMEGPEELRGRVALTSSKGSPLPPHGAESINDYIARAIRHAKDTHGPVRAEFNEMTFDVSEEDNFKSAKERYDHARKNEVEGWNPETRELAAWGSIEDYISSLLKKLKEVGGSIHARFNETTFDVSEEDNFKSAKERYDHALALKMKNEVEGWNPETRELAAWGGIEDYISSLLKKLKEVGGPIHARFNTTKFDVVEGDDFEKLKKRYADANERERERTQKQEALVVRSMLRRLEQEASGAVTVDKISKSDYWAPKFKDPKDAATAVMFVAFFRAGLEEHGKPGESGEMASLTGMLKSYLGGHLSSDELSSVKLAVHQAAEAGRPMSFRDAADRLRDSLLKSALLRLAASPDADRRVVGTSILYLLNPEEVGLFAVIQGRLAKERGDRNGSPDKSVTADDLSDLILTAYASIYREVDLVGRVSEKGKGLNESAVRELVAVFSAMKTGDAVEIGREDLGRAMNILRGDIHAPKVRELLSYFETIQDQQEGPVLVIEGAGVELILGAAEKKPGVSKKEWEQAFSKDSLLAVAMGIGPERAAALKTFRSAYVKGAEVPVGNLPPGVPDLSWKEAESDIAFGRLKIDAQTGVVSPTGDPAKFMRTLRLKRDRREPAGLAEDILLQAARELGRGEALEMFRESYVRGSRVRVPNVSPKFDVSWHKAEMDIVLGRLMIDPLTRVLAAEGDPQKYKMTVPLEKPSLWQKMRTIDWIAGSQEKTPAAEIAAGPIVGDVEEHESARLLAEEFRKGTAQASALMDLADKLAAGDVDAVLPLQAALEKAGLDEQSKLIVSVAFADQLTEGGKTAREAPLSSAWPVVLRAIAQLGPAARNDVILSVLKEQLVLQEGKTQALLVERALRSVLGFDLEAAERLAPAGENDPALRKANVKILEMVRFNREVGSAMAPLRREAADLGVEGVRKIAEILVWRGDESAMRDRFQPHEWPAAGNILDVAREIAKEHPEALTATVRADRDRVIVEVLDKMVAPRAALPSPGLTTSGAIASTRLDALEGQAEGGPAEPKTIPLVDEEPAVEGVYQAQENSRLQMSVAKGILRRGEAKLGDLQAGDKAFTSAEAVAMAKTLRSLIDDAEMSLAALADAELAESRAWNVAKDLLHRVRGLVSKGMADVPVALRKQESRLAKSTSWDTARHDQAYFQGERLRALAGKLKLELARLDELAGLAETAAEPATALPDERQAERLVHAYDMARVGTRHQMSEAEKFLARAEAKLEEAPLNGQASGPEERITAESIAILIFNARKIRAALSEANDDEARRRTTATAFLRRVQFLYLRKPEEDVTGSLRRREEFLVYAVSPLRDSHMRAEDLMEKIDTMVSRLGHAKGKIDQAAGPAKAAAESETAGNAATKDFSAANGMHAWGDDMVAPAMGTPRRERTAAQPVTTPAIEDGQVSRIESSYDRGRERTLQRIKSAEDLLMRGEQKLEELSLNGKDHKPGEKSPAADSLLSLIAEAGVARKGLAEANDEETRVRNEAVGLLRRVEFILLGEPDEDVAGSLRKQEESLVSAVSPSRDNHMRAEDLLEKIGTMVSRLRYALGILDGSIRKPGTGAAPGKESKGSPATIGWLASGDDIVTRAMRAPGREGVVVGVMLTLGFAVIASYAQGNALWAYLGAVGAAAAVWRFSRIFGENPFLAILAIPLLGVGVKFLVSHLSVNLLAAAGVLGVLVGTYLAVNLLFGLFHHKDDQGRLIGPADRLHKAWKGATYFHTPFLWSGMLAVAVAHGVPGGHAISVLAGLAAGLLLLITPIPWTGAFQFRTSELRHRVYNKVALGLPFETAAELLALEPMVRSIYAPMDDENQYGDQTKLVRLGSLLEKIGRLKSSTDKTGAEAREILEFVNGYDERLRTRDLSEAGTLREDLKVPSPATIRLTGPSGKAGAPAETAPGFKDAASVKDAVARVLRNLGPTAKLDFNDLDPRYGADLAEVHGVVLSLRAKSEAERDAALDAALAGKDFARKAVNWAAFMDGLDDGRNDGPDRTPFMNLKEGFSQSPEAERLYMRGFLTGLAAGLESDPERAPKREVLTDPSGQELDSLKDLPALAALQAAGRLEVRRGAQVEMEGDQVHVRKTLEAAYPGLTPAEIARLHIQPVTQSAEDLFTEDLILVLKRYFKGLTEAIGLDIRGILAAAIAA